VPPGPAVVLGLRDGFEVRRFQAPAVQAGATADARRVPVVACVVDVLARLKLAPGKREHQAVAQ
jgi:hypothetical protein